MKKKDGKRGRIGRKGWWEEKKYGKMEIMKREE